MESVELSFFLLLPHFGGGWEGVTHRTIPITASFHKGREEPSP
ncbi:MAG: hypothetical protein IEMM0008_1778 [bacterium]|nr:MAG: hypothetical protein IEMM0008_1778 [bacterium]